MSTHLRRGEAELPPASLPDLIDYFRAGSKPRERWRVGAEFEKFALDRTTGKQITFDGPHGIESILGALAARFGWEPHHESGRLTTLTRGGECVSVEPGGQVELSTSACRELSVIRDELNTHLQELRAVTDSARVAWCAAGVTPFSAVDEIALNPRPRHRLMAEFLPAKSPFALHMMKATCSVQATFDYSDEADAGRKVGTALRLSPFVNAAFANGPLCAGKPTGFASFRGHVWLNMDPERSGFLDDLLAGEVTFARWVDVVLDVPMLFVLDGDTLRPSNGVTFRTFLNHGIDDLLPTLQDWELHLSTVFTEVRLKHFLEVRGADANCGPLSLTVPALWKGILYHQPSLDAAAELAATIPPADLRAVSESASRSGLGAEYRGRSLAEWGREIAALSAAGLQTWGEAAFLDPLREVLERGQSPGTRLSREIGENPRAANVLERIEW
jgi:glutamate--cysteine ligase